MTIQFPNNLQRKEYLLAPHVGDTTPDGILWHCRCGIDDSGGWNDSKIKSAIDRLDSAAPKNSRYYYEIGPVGIRYDRLYGIDSDGRAS